MKNHGPCSEFHSSLQIASKNSDLDLLGQASGVLFRYQDVVDLDPELDPQLQLEFDLHLSDDDLYPDPDLGSDVFELARLGCLSWAAQ